MGSTARLGATSGQPAAGRWSSVGDAAASTLSPKLTRARGIETLAGERFDIVVIGGGITGAGVALDAASRGYSVALVEKADFASGTRSRSSKLVQGGCGTSRSSCRTHEIPLGEPVDPASLPRVEGVSEQSYLALASRYGHAAGRVLQTASERGELAQPIIPGLPDLVAEAPFSARNEQARSVGDVLLRRTRLGLPAGRELSSPGSEAPARVARGMGRERDWDEPRIAAEIKSFRREAQAEGIAPDVG